MFGATGRDMGSCRRVDWTRWDPQRPCLSWKAAEKSPAQGCKPADRYTVTEADASLTVHTGHPSPATTESRKPATDPEQCDPSSLLRPLAGSCEASASEEGGTGAVSSLGCFAAHCWRGRLDPGTSSLARGSAFPSAKPQRSSDKCLRNHEPLRLALKLGFANWFSVLSGPVAGAVGGVEEAPYCGVAGAGGPWSWQFSR
ncbi:hypothetical protein EDB81DRAFT_804228 [Dactylonectria macrodidyma]|uniref:Uncharacterized protein n=1 Tax=Dactylonectria macrodidyma TaxID=307937 RepID=A0A9P9EAC1_9HYPO|nr:hypothetical protein EDB81DRAFT_804228 [Dactylonectria macrodidyma]